MTRRTAIRDMRKWPGILLLLVCTPTTQLQAAVALEHQQNINATHESLNVSSENNTNSVRGTDHEISVKPLVILNNNTYNNSSYNNNQTEIHPSTIQDSILTSTTNAHIIQDKIIDTESYKHSVPEKIDPSQRPLIDNKNHESILVTKLNPQGNNDDKLLLDNDKESLSNTASITPMIKSTNNDSIISSLNDTIVNHHGGGVPIEQSYDEIMLKNVTIPHIENAPNVTSKYSNIVEHSNNTEEEMAILKPVLRSSKDSEIISIEKDTVVMNYAQQKTTTMTNNLTTDTINDSKFFVTTPTLKNITTSTERIESTYDSNDSVQRARTITFGGISHPSDVEDQAIRLVKGEGIVHPHENRNNNSDNNNNNQNNNVINSPIDKMSSIENTIGKSNEDEKMIITVPSLIIDDNSIQPMKQSTNYKKPEKSSTSNMTKLSGTFMKHTILQLRNHSNSSVTMGSDINNNENNIPHNVGGESGSDDVLVEKRSNLDLSDNGLHEAVEKNSTNSKLTLFTGMTPIHISGNTTEMDNNSNESFPITYLDSQSYTQGLKLIITPSNITKDSTKVESQLNDTYLSSGAPSPFPTLQNSPSTLSLTTFSPISTTPNFDVPISDTTANDIAEQTLITVAASSSTILNSSPTTNTVLQVDDSSGRAIDSTQTTMANVELEFIGLTSGTNKNRPNRNYTASNNHEVELMENPNLRNTNITATTVANPFQNLSNTTTNFPDIAESASTSDDDTYVNTTAAAHSTVMNVDFYGDTTPILDVTTTTVLPYTATFTYYPDIISPSTTAIDSAQFNVTDQSEVSTTTSDTSDPIAMTTTMASSSSSIFEYGGGRGVVEVETSSTIIDSTTAVDVAEENTTIGTIQITSDTTTHGSVPGDDVTVFVKMVVQSSWSDMCPQLLALKQALADVLSAGANKIVFPHQVIFRKNPCTDDIKINSGATASMEATISTTFLLYIVNQDGDFDETLTKILPSLYRESALKLKNISIRSFQLVEELDSGNAIAVIVVSCVAFICLVLLASLLFVMRKRQTRFNYGERCRPVSLDAYSLDSVSAYDSVRRKGAVRMSKRSYGNPTFEDSSAIPSHPLNFAGLSAFYIQHNAISEEFSSIPQLSACIDELPNGAEMKNRYANVIPLPETRVPLKKINNDPLSEYINASYVRGPKNAIKYYIGCQAPIDSTVVDFWRMIWEQQSKVIIMLTDIIENGVEKCVEYIPASEVIDCHRLYGDLQVTLKKRETKEQYAISTLLLKNLVTNTYREIYHIWYLWPTNGIQTDTAGLIAVLLEARAAQRGDSGPIVVHCSPGTGRTGTLIALDLGIRQYELTRTIDVPRIVYTIRRDRAGAVQTKEQYCFIYKALNFYATKLAGGGGGGLEST